LRPAPVGRAEKFVECNASDWQNRAGSRQARAARGTRRADGRIASGGARSPGSRLGYEVAAGVSWKPCRRVNTPFRRGPNAARFRAESRRQTTNASVTERSGSRFSTRSTRSGGERMSEISRPRSRWLRGGCAIGLSTGCPTGTWPGALRDATYGRLGASCNAGPTAGRSIQRCVNGARRTGSCGRGPIMVRRRRASARRMRRDPTRRFAVVRGRAEFEPIEVPWAASAGGRRRLHGALMDVSRSGHRRRYR